MTRPNKFPQHRLSRINPAELAGRIARARAMRLAALTEQQVDARIARLMDGYATKPVTFGLNGFFRARVHPSGVEQFKDFSELWYPPVEAVTRAGRFNRAGEVRLYASNRIQGAIFEVQPKPGDMVTLVMIASKKPLEELRCVHIGLQRCREAEEVTRGINLYSDASFLAELRAAGVHHKWLRLDRYLSDLATANVHADEAEHHYKATNAVGSLLSRIRDSQALVYPGIATSLKSFNLCLPTETADTLFFPFEAWSFRITARVDELPGAPVSESGYIGVEPVARTAEVGPSGGLTWQPVESSQQSLEEMQKAFTRVPRSK